MPSDQFGGQPDVLAFLADGERKLVLGDGNGQAFLFKAVDFNLRNLGRRQSIRGKHRRVFAPLDYVYSLAPQLSNNRLNSRALHSNAGADRIDVALGRNDGDFGAVAGLAHDAFDLDGAVIDLGHFHLEQSLYQLGRCAGYLDLGALGFFGDRVYYDANSLALTEGLGPGLFHLRQY